MREFLKKLEEFSKLDADDSLSTVGDLARLVPFPAPAELAAFMAELVSLQRRLDRIEDYPELVASGIKQRAMDLQADAVILIERINRDSCLTGLAKLQQRLLEAVWATGRIKTTELALL